MGFTPAMVLVALGRLADSGSSLGRDNRYLSLSVTPALIGVALAVGSAWPASNPAAGLRAAVAPRPVRAGGVLVGLVIVAELVSSITAARTWSTLRTDAYLETFAADVDRMRQSTGTPTLSLLDENVPDWILVHDFLGPNTSQTSKLLPPVRTGGISYDGAVQTLYRVNGSGHIVPARLVNAAPLESVGKSCTKGGKSEQLRVTPGQQLGPASGYVIGLHLTSQSQFTVYLRLRSKGKVVDFRDYDDATFTVPAGTHTVVAAEEGNSFDAVGLVIHSAKSVCLTSAEASQLAPD
jgi:hypothetical protein